MYFKPISLSLALAGLLLAGCSSTDKPAATPAAEAPASAAAPALSGTCDSAAVASLVGKTADTALVEQAKRQSGAETARVLHPNQPITMDYNSRRLNIDVDDSNVVKQLTCG